MAILEEANLLAERARHAKYRTHHVGTKLNEHELHEFEALAERRQQTPSELIRGLVLGEIERDQHFLSGWFGFGKWVLGQRKGERYHGFLVGASAREMDRFLRHGMVTV